MGWGIIPGLVMNTRSGSIDPRVVIFLIRDLKMTPEEADKFFLQNLDLLDRQED